MAILFPLPSSKARVRAMSSANWAEVPGGRGLASMVSNWRLLHIRLFLHLGLPYAYWAWPGVLFLLPEVFTLVLGPSLSLSHRHFGLLFPILPT